VNADPNITVMTSREFNQDTAKAKRAARKGPVYVTERGTVSHVLLTKSEFDRREAGAQGAPKKFVSLADMLAHPESAHIDFDVPERKGFWGHKVPDFED
jgi:hypothetical protein